MYKFIAIIAICCVMSCDRKPFVEHKVKEEKVADDCKDRQSYFRMISNFGGERYEFEKCLHPEFNGRNEVISWRSSDTVYVGFKSPDAAPGDKVFHITLDIDSYPEYHYISIDGDTYSISSPEK